MGADFIDIIPDCIYFRKNEGSRLKTPTSLDDFTNILMSSCNIANEHHSQASKLPYVQNKLCMHNKKVKKLMVTD